MGALKETADELINEYRNPSKRWRVIQYDLKGMRMKMLRKMVHYFYAKHKVPERHNDRMFMFKLVAWAIIERSKVLEDYQINALLRHRKALLEKGPLPDDQLALSSDTSGLNRKRRKERDRMNDMAKKETAAKETKKVEKKEKAAKEKVIKIAGKEFPANHKFKLKKNAEHSNDWKGGKGGLVALAYSKARTIEEAEEYLKKEITSGSLKGKVDGKPAEAAEDLAWRVLRRLVHDQLVEGTGGPAEFKEPKEKPKAKKEEKKAGKKSKAKAEEEDEEEDEDEDDEDEEDEPKAKKGKGKAKKAKAVEEEEDDEDEDDEEDDDVDDEDDEEEEEDEEDEDDEEEEAPKAKRKKK